MKQHVKFYTILKAKTLMLTYLRKNYLVIRFKGIKDLIFSSSNLKRHVKLLEEVTKYYVVNIQRTSVIPFFVRSHRKVKRWSGIVLIGQRDFGESFETFAKCSYTSENTQTEKILSKFSSQFFIYRGKKWTQESSKIEMREWFTSER